MENESGKLSPEQRYIFSVAEHLGIAPLPTLQHHGVATTTCAEKAALLGWDVGRTVKALYFQMDHHFLGVIVPELVTFERRSVLALFTGSKNQAKGYELHRRFPRGMELGTCTPFPLEFSVGEEIRGIAIIDSPALDPVVVDISVGGVGEPAHKMSLHLPYGGISAVLQAKFGDQYIKRYVG